MKILEYEQWIKYHKYIVDLRTDIFQQMKAESDSVFGPHISKTMGDLRFINLVISHLKVIEQYDLHIVYDTSTIESKTINVNSNVDNNRNKSTEKNTKENFQTATRKRAIKLCFSLGEANAYLSRLNHYQDEPDTYAIEVIQVSECLANTTESPPLFSLLCERFISVETYDGTPLTLLALNKADWHWVLDGRDIYNVLVDETSTTPVIFPPAWSLTKYGVNSDAYYKYGPIEAMLLPIANSAGLWGLCDVNGKIVVPCQYQALNPTNGVVNATEFEVAEGNPSSLSWHLIGCDGQRINPEGFNIVQGEYSFLSSDIRVIQQNISPYLSRYISTKGDFLGDTLWERVGVHEWDRGWVQDIKTHLYGFVDRLGELAVACKYTKVTGFSSCSRYRTRYAMVALQLNVKETPLWGCIDMDGNELMAPQWLAICEFSNGYMLVQANASSVQLVTLFGEPTGVTLAVNLPQYFDNLYWALTEDQRENLTLQLKTTTKNKFNIKLTSGMNLAFLANKVSDESELKAVNIVGKQAILLDDINGYDFLKKGTVVTIAFRYPATASMFDFKQEVPVQNSTSKQEHYGIGVPWALLELV